MEHPEITVFRLALGEVIYKTRCALFRFGAHITAMFIFAVLLLPQITHAQVFRGYSSGEQIKFNEEKTGRREVIKGYYPDGQVEFVVSFRKGKIDGDLKEYYENGMLKAEIPYEEGLRDGVARFYYENGMLMFKVYYEKDMETGRAKFYDSNGYLTASINIDKNRLRQGRRAERIRERNASGLTPEDSR